MRIVGMAGLLLALALMGYLVVSYLHRADNAQELLRAFSGASSASGPVNLTKKGLEQRLAPVLDQERQRVEDTNKAADQ